MATTTTTTTTTSAPTTANYVPQRLCDTLPFPAPMNSKDVAELRRELARPDPRRGLLTNLDFIQVYAFV